MSADPIMRELEWYLRDHLFRQSNAGKTSFKKELVPRELVSLYLRYRSTGPQELSNTLPSVIDILIARKVLKQENSELKLLGRLRRLQCAKCFYINYLTEIEPLSCLRCQNNELYDFPKKKP
jgi:hypothetical protein